MCVYVCVTCSFPEIERFTSMKRKGHDVTKINTQTNKGKLLEIRNRIAALREN